MPHHHEHYNGHNNMLMIMPFAILIIIMSVSSYSPFCSSSCLSLSASSASAQYTSIYECIIINKFHRYTDFEKLSPQSSVPEMTNTKPSNSLERHDPKSTAGERIRSLDDDSVRLFRTGDTLGGVRYTAFGGVRRSL